LNNIKGINHVGSITDSALNFVDQIGLEFGVEFDRRFIDVFAFEKVSFKGLDFIVLIHNVFQTPPVGQIY